MTKALAVAERAALLGRELAGEFPDPRGRYGAFGGPTYRKRSCPRSTGLKRA